MVLKVVSGSSGGGSGTVTSVATGTGLTGGPITTTGTVSLANTTVTAGIYGNATTVSQVTINAQGQITSAANVAIAIANTAITNGNITLGNTTIGLGNTATTVGNLTLNNVTINSGNSTVTTGSIGYANISTALRTQALTGYLYGNANTGNVTAATTIPNAGLANSTATLGNTAITLGSTTTSVGNLTLNNVTINGLNTSLTTKSANYTGTLIDGTILGNASTGNITITLPTSVGATGRTYAIKKIDSSANVVIIATTSSQTIDAFTTEILARQFDAVQVQSDGANWVIISFVPGRNGTSGSF
jgi:hypothetical protein